MLPIIYALTAVGAAVLIISLALAKRGRRKTVNNAEASALSTSIARADEAACEQLNEAEKPQYTASGTIVSEGVHDGGSGNNTRFDYDARKVLIVDDQPMIRLMLKEVLETSGLHVLEASAGQEALELCSRHAFDLFLFDMRMPGMSGIELLRHIRHSNDHSNANVPCAFISALGDPDLEREAEKLGVTAFIAKPFDIFEVRDYVMQAISPNQQRRNAQ